MIFDSDIDRRDLEYYKRVVAQLNNDSEIRFFEHGIRYLEDRLGIPECDRHKPKVDLNKKNRR